jgi:signal peptidase I
VVVNKVAYALRLPFSEIPLLSFAGPRRGDVVVLISPEDGSTLLKRVVAVPGDEVSVRGGQLRINGVEVPIAGGPGDSGRWEALGNGHPVRLTRRGGDDLPPVRVGAGEYLVLGDNRGESHDGRAFGLVPRRAIRGQVISVWMRDGSPCWRPL